MKKLTHLYVCFSCCLTFSHFFTFIYIFTVWDIHIYIISSSKLKSMIHYVQDNLIQESISVHVSLNLWENIKNMNSYDQHIPWSWSLAAGNVDSRISRKILSAHYKFSRLVLSGNTALFPLTGILYLISFQNLERGDRDGDSCVSSPPFSSSSLLLTHIPVLFLFLRFFHKHTAPCLFLSRRTDSGKRASWAGLISSSSTRTTFKDPSLRVLCIAATHSNCCCVSE